MQYGGENPEEVSVKMMEPVIHRLCCYIGYHSNGLHKYSSVFIEMPLFDSFLSGSGDWGDQPIKENTKMIRQGVIHHNINKSNTKVITMKLS